MTSDVDTHILRMNYVECLVNYLEGTMALPVVLELTERLRQRDPQTLSTPLRSAVAELHHLNQRVAQGEELDRDTINDAVSAALLDLTI